MISVTKMGQACLVTAFVRSSSSPTRGQTGPLKQTTSITSAELMSNDNTHVIGQFYAWFSAFVCHERLFFYDFSRKKVVSLLSAMETLCFSACFDQSALHVYHRLWSEGLWRQRAVTWACSLLSKTKTFQTLSLHMPQAERENVSHHDCWNFSTASKCVFHLFKDSKLCPNRRKCCLII